MLVDGLKTRVGIVVLQQGLVMVIFMLIEPDPAFVNVSELLGPFAAIVISFYIVKVYSVEGAAAVDPAEAVFYEKMSKMKGVVEVMSSLSVVHVRLWVSA